MLDIHCHILPGIDHGARDMAEARRMLEAAAAQGVKHIVATPHVYDERFDRAAAKRAYEALRPHAQRLNIRLTLGYEFNISALNLKNPARARDFRIEGSNRLLLEMPFDIWPPNWRMLIGELQRMGLEIILAHPERYEPLQDKLSRVHDLAEMGVLFQVDVPQALKPFSKQRRVLRELMKLDALDYAASDAHCAEDYARFGRSIGKLDGYIRESDWRI